MPTEVADKNVSITLAVNAEIFPIEVVFSAEDDIKNTPVMYMPYLPKEKDKVLPEWIKTEAWDAFEKKLNQSTEEMNLNYSLEDSEENFTEKDTDELKLIRRGKIMVRVYGPPEGQYCNLKTKLRMKVLQKIYDQRNWTSAKMSLCYKQGDRLVKVIKTFPGNAGDYRIGDGIGTPIDSYTTVVRTEAPFCTEITSTGSFQEEGNTYNNPCKNFKRKTHEKFTETLTFVGEYSKRIKYWYVDPKRIKVLVTSVFVDKDGLPLTQSQIPSNDRTTVSTYFIATMPCWGSIIVEYDVDYTLFCVLYDLEKPKRKYRVMPGEVVRVGYLTASKANKLIANEKELAGNQLKSEKELNRYDDRLKLYVKSYLALTTKVEFLPYNLRPITLFVTDGINLVTATFTPKVEFNDWTLDKFPKMAIFERRTRENYVDHIEEVTFIDVMGNITTEHLEIRK